MFCSNCGYDLKNGEAFCPNCGTATSAEPQPTSRLKSTFGGAKPSGGIGMGTINREPLESPRTTAPTTSFSSPTPTPTDTPTSTSYDYSSPREYVPATTNNYKMIKIIIAVVLLISVWLLPVFSVEEYSAKVERSGLSYTEACFKTFETIFDNAEYLDEMLEEPEGVAAFIEPFAFLLYAFSSIGVLVGALSSKKSRGKGSAILGVVSGVSWLITLVVVLDSYYGNASITDVIGYGFWISCGLYISSAVLASKE